MTTTYDKVIQLANTLQAEGKYDSTYSAVLAIYQNLTGDTETKFDSTYSIVATIADGVESGDINIGGGGEEEVKDYNTHKFYNVNGELVEEWTLEETQSKTELPVIDGVPYGSWTLDFDGWNWDLEQLKAATCGQNIGAMYRPSDGKTRIVVEIEPENLTYVLFIGGDYEIDWGDGTTGWGDLYEGYPTHTYESEGTKMITLTGTNILPQWGVSPTYTMIYEGYPGWYYGGRVKTFMSGVELNSMAFGYCTNLEFLTFTSDEHVYDSSFYNFTETKSLRYLAIPKGITSYPTTGKSIEVISMPYGVTSVGYGAILDYYLLLSINIPDSVTGIEDYAFHDCRRLQSITIPNSVTSIGSYVFEQCSSLQSIKIPNSVTSIGGFTFYNCSSLQSIIIGNDVNSIGSSAFRDCSSLQSVNIPDGVTSIEGSVFNGCRSLQYVNIPNSVNVIDNYAFQNCTSLQSINIPNSVLIINDYVFYGCSSLQSINIPYSITFINSRTFYDCSSLQSITIPNTITSIKMRAFYLCQYITVDFSDYTQVPELASTDAFDSTALILVPSSLYDEWINATNWSSLTSQIVAV